MVQILRHYGKLPVFARFTIGGTVTFGLIGAVTGLILGLRTYITTAWAAVLEAGIPAAIAGAVMGIVVGSAVDLGRRVRLHRNPTATPRPDRPRHRRRNSHEGP